MKNILFLSMALFSTACYCQTQQDVYIHNGDNEWNQKRLDADKKLEYQKRLNELQQKQIDENNQKAAECAATVVQLYKQITTFKEIPDGDYHTWSTDFKYLCHDTWVKVSGGKVVSLGSATIIYSSEVKNQFAKVNIKMGEFSAWLDVYFIY